MTLDRTLKQSGGLVRQRSVLTRAERIAKMTDEGTFDSEQDSPFGLPKIKVKHSRAGTKTKKVEAPTDETTEATEEEVAPEE